MFFAGVHRQPRYSTNGSGVIVASWKAMDAFEISEGDEGGLVLVYNSGERTGEDAQQWLNAYGYTDSLANGSIDARKSEPEWRFKMPADSIDCRAMMRQVVSDPEFLRYFAHFQVIGPDGDRFGRADTFGVLGDESI